MNEIVIDKGVEIPRRQYQGKNRTYPFDQMEVGDSFFIAESDEADCSVISNRLRNAAHRFAASSPTKFALRQLEENGETGIRIWRTA